MANLSENKVRVTKLFGAGATVGWMNPRPNMRTQQGTIVQVKDSGRFVVCVSGQGVGTLTDYYPHQLFVHVDQATGVFSFPSGDGSVVFGHHSEWPSGVPMAQGSGMYYGRPDGTPFAFQRP